MEQQHTAANAFWLALILSERAEKDLIFVDGVVYELGVDSAEARYDNNVKVSSGHEAARYGFKKILESDDIWPRDEKCDFGNKSSKSDNIWIGTISVGNFDNDENGGEQLVFDHGRKRSGEDEYRHDMVFIHKGTDGSLISDNACINNDRSAAYTRNLDLTAIDNDDDGMKMKFKSKSAYFFITERSCGIAGSSLFCRP